MVVDLHGGAAAVEQSRLPMAAAVEQSIGASTLASAASSVRGE